MAQPSFRERFLGAFKPKDDLTQAEEHARSARVVAGQRDKADILAEEAQIREQAEITARAEAKDRIALDRSFKDDVDSTIIELDERRRRSVREQRGHARRAVAGKPRGEAYLRVMKRDAPNDTEPVFTKEERDEHVNDLSDKRKVDIFIAKVEKGLVGLRERIRTDERTAKKYATQVEKNLDAAIAQVRDMEISDARKKEAIEKLYRLRQDLFYDFKDFLQKLRADWRSAEALVREREKDLPFVEVNGHRYALEQRVDFIYRLTPEDVQERYNGAVRKGYAPVNGKIARVYEKIAMGQPEAGFNEKGQSVTFVEILDDDTTVHVFPASELDFYAASDPFRREYERLKLQDDAEGDEYAGVDLAKAREIGARLPQDIRADLDEIVDRFKAYEENIAVQKYASLKESGKTKERALKKVAEFTAEKVGNNAIKKYLLEDAQLIIYATKSDRVAIYGDQPNALAVQNADVVGYLQSLVGDKIDVLRVYLPTEADIKAYRADREREAGNKAASYAESRDLVDVGKAVAKRAKALPGEVKAGVKGARQELEAATKLLVRDLAEAGEGAKIVGGRVVAAGREMKKTYNGIRQGTDRALQEITENVGDDLRKQRYGERAKGWFGKKWDGLKQLVAGKDNRTTRKPNLVGEYENRHLDDNLIYDSSTQTGSLGFREAREKYGFAIHETRPKETKRLVDNITFSDDAMPFNGRRLTVEALKAADMLPKIKIEVGEATLYIPDKVYRLNGDGRLATVVYIQYGDTLKARTFYQSSSQGSWRLLNAYTLDGDGDVDWYHKGFGENSIQAPIALQRIMPTVSGNIISVPNSEILFFGTAGRNNPTRTFAFDVNAKGAELGDNFGYQNMLPDPRDPESFKFYDAQDKPNFSQPVDRWVEDKPTYGRVMHEVFQSANGKYLYVFCRDHRNRYWISCIEDVASPVMRVGVKENWVNSHALTTPAYEYRSQSAGYGDDSDRAGSKGQYVDMYKNYLRHVPLIQEYRDYIIKNQGTMVIDINAPEDKGIAPPEAPATPIEREARSVSQESRPPAPEAEPKPTIEHEEFIRHVLFYFANNETHDFNYVRRTVHEMLAGKESPVRLTRTMVENDSALYHYVSEQLGGDNAMITAFLKALPTAEDYATYDQRTHDDSEVDHGDTDDNTPHVDYVETPITAEALEASGPQADPQIVSMLQKAQRRVNASDAFELKDSVLGATTSKKQLAERSTVPLTQEEIKNSVEFNGGNRQDDVQPATAARAKETEDVAEEDLARRLVAEHEHMDPALVVSEIVAMKDEELRSILAQQIAPELARRSPDDALRLTVYIDDTAARAHTLQIIDEARTQLDGQETDAAQNITAHFETMKPEDVVNAVRAISDRELRAVTAEHLLGYYAENDPEAALDLMLYAQDRRVLDEATKKIIEKRIEEIPAKQAEKIRREIALAERLADHFETMKPEDVIEDIYKISDRELREVLADRMLLYFAEHNFDETMDLMRFTANQTLRQEAAQIIIQKRGEQAAKKPRREVKKPIIADEPTGEITAEVDTKTESPQKFEKAETAAREAKTALDHIHTIASEHPLYPVFESRLRLAEAKMQGFIDEMGDADDDADLVEAQTLFRGTAKSLYDQMAVVVTVNELVRRDKSGLSEMKTNIAREHVPLYVELFPQKREDLIKNGTQETPDAASAQVLLAYLDFVGVPYEEFRSHLPTERLVKRADETLTEGQKATAEIAFLIMVMRSKLEGSARGQKLLGEFGNELKEVEEMLQKAQLLPQGEATQATAGILEKYFDLDNKLRSRGQALKAGEARAKAEKESRGQNLRNLRADLQALKDKAKARVIPSEPVKRKGRDFTLNGQMEAIRTALIRLENTKKPFDTALFEQTKRQVVRVSEYLDSLPLITKQAGPVVEIKRTGNRLPQGSLEFSSAQKDDEPTTALYGTSDDDDENDNSPTIWQETLDAIDSAEAREVEDAWLPVIEAANANEKALVQELSQIQNARTRLGLLNEILEKRALSPKLVEVIRNNELDTFSVGLNNDHVFTLGEAIDYRTTPGAEPQEYTVIGISGDTNPGLVLRNNKTGRKFAVSGIEANFTKITKKNDTTKN